MNKAANGRKGLGWGKQFVAGVMLLLFVGSWAQAATFTVTDSGDGVINPTLRKCIGSANLLAGADTIVFNLPEGDRIINLTSELPALDDSSGGTTINGGGIITLNGASAGNSHGLILSSNTNVINGLIIGGFQKSGIVIGGSYNVVTGCLIGYDGRFVIANGWGVSITGGRATLGGSTSSERNIISGNTNAGVYVTSSTGAINIYGNYIGATATGGSAVPNGGPGVQLADAPSVRIGGTSSAAGNVISGNTMEGISVSGAASTNITIQNNYIGLTANGSSPLGNGSHGVSVEEGSCSISDNIIVGNLGHGIILGGIDGAAISGNLIGNCADATGDLENAMSGLVLSGSSGASVEGNVISGNAEDGVLINGGAQTNTFTNNIIGLSADGTTDVPNGGAGMHIDNGSNNVLEVAVDGTVLRNIISGNTGNGVWIENIASTGNTVRGCLIGTNPDGTTAIPNGGAGIYLDNAQASIIGGTGENDGNLISGNTNQGIYLYGAGGDMSAVIQGNSIGTDMTGVSAILNSSHGIMVEESGSNTLGGAFETEGNLISGNAVEGILIRNSSGNSVFGNRIGTNREGTASLANGQNGIVVDSGSSGNHIGDGVAGHGNLISGNSEEGIDLVSSSNFLQGNYIGTDISGMLSVPNRSGVAVESGAQMCMIGGTAAGAGNLISGNSNFGIIIFTTDTANNVVKGNKIGCDVSGSNPLPNGSIGVYLTDHASQNVIGGAEDGAANIIAFNGSKGVWVRDGSTGISILRNSIHDNTEEGIVLDPGTNGDIAAPVITTLGSVDGTAPPYALVDVFVDEADEGRLFIGTAIAEDTGDFHVDVDLLPYNGLNVTALATDTTTGCTSAFSAPAAIFFDATITVTDSGDSGPHTLRAAIEQANAMTGENTIVFDLSKTVTITLSSALPALNDSSAPTVINGAGQIVLDGSGLSGSDNGLVLLSDGNEVRGLGIVNFPYAGVNISGNNNTVAECTLGTDGTSSMPNAVGIYVADGSGTIIGGGDGLSGNIISGNSSAGVHVGSSATATEILGNYIGVDATGMAAMGNGYYGVWINGSPGNVIGGESETSGNIIAGNAGGGEILIDGAAGMGNMIYGNYIGLDKDGASALAVQYATGIDVMAPQTQIGGENIGYRNIISGCFYGIRISGVDGHDCAVQGNYIGTDASGMMAIANELAGVSIVEEATNNLIGGGLSWWRNLISGNGSCGVRLMGANVTGNKVQGNWIGPNALGTGAPSGNPQSWGVQAGWHAEDNTIGGTTPGEGNTIAFNYAAGVYLEETVLYVRISGNSIYSNGGLGIELLPGANNNVPAPVITALGSIDGTSIALATIEAFADDEDEGRIFLGAASSDGSGNFHLDVDITPYAGMNITATATASDGNTSVFSAPYPVPGGEEGEGAVEEGETEGVPSEGSPEEGQAEGVEEGEGAPEGEGGEEGIAEGEGGEEGGEEGEGEDGYLTPDQDQDGFINLSELLRVIQFFNSDGFHCEAGTEDGYAPGPGDTSCAPYDSDYNAQDWHISLSELLRVIQFFNSGGYHYCPGEGTEDGFCPGL
ncbi:MAG TPA: right-handed parallel beta-helix repeat-containing protein [Candidatus Hydrogenedentes bacterium]|nr:right-handed parallel beta-helix repeat-containing protein [Candidatus Hydrogenedentota bacterium]